MVQGDVASYVSMLLDSFTALAESRNIEIVYAPKQKQMPMDFVPDYIQKIVCNLMSNAIKFSKPDSNILVTTAIDDGKFTLRIADFGVGMSQEDQKHIFDLYHQNNDGLSDMGSGIGLTLVKQITKQLNGTITVESSLGKGSVFTVILPATCCQNVKELSTSQPARQQIAADSIQYTGIISDEDEASVKKKTTHDPLP